MSLDIDQLLTELTVPEKASLTSGSHFWYTASVERLGIPKIMVSDGPHGLRAQPGEGDHVGLGGSVPATCFPTASAVASAWNPDLLTRIGEALAQEARACNLSVILGPGINMKRSPLCGRNFEYFSEDPYLAGELAVGIVDGIQSRGVGTSVKHYAANNQESDRLRVDAQVDERTLREIYLPAFERVVTASQPWTIMCAYNKVNGQSASENTWLLTTVLREEYGFEGLVVSDWGAVYHRVPALLAGLDLEMPPALGRSPEAVAAAVEAGEVPIEVLDARVRTVLELVAKGMPVLELDESFDPDAHHALAREAAAESVVLLKNDGLLPLPADAKIAVIGEFARTPRFQGAGSSQVTPTRVDVLLDELPAGYGDVPFAAGYGIGQTADDADLLAEAERVAASADTVVMVIGLPGADESEGFDRTHMDLPANQLAALKAVAAVNADVVVVLVNGSTVVLGDVTPYARALVEAWLGGQAAGGAIADVLAGAVEPVRPAGGDHPAPTGGQLLLPQLPGRLPGRALRRGAVHRLPGLRQGASRRRVPVRLRAVLHHLRVVRPRGDHPGRRGRETFGATVTVTVANTGSVDGAEVVQVYVTDVESTVARPVRELKGFAKVSLAAGASKRCRSSSTSARSPSGRSSTAAGRSRRGTSSSASVPTRVNLPLTETITVDAPRLASPLSRDSTLQEWMSDPIGRQLIEEEVAGGQSAAVLTRAHRR